ncbi:hypothetical protein CEXT_30711 [Caerostris extrusa]|uniref:Uncharacterized protein n=1 Tax=Caerostris extrusa TaxID=172846 RepID=A0AAV4R3N9_CAEEX|nr:hypothetical protein CEXT_30711 [Caerostris extrusa]
MGWKILNPASWVDRFEAEYSLKPVSDGVMKCLNRLQFATRYLEHFDAKFQRPHFTIHDASRTSETRQFSLCSQLRTIEPKSLEKILTIILENKDFHNPSVQITYTE